MSAPGPVSSPLSREARDATNEKLIERARAAATVAVNHELLAALADALETAESHYEMAHVDHVEAEQRAERAEALVSTLGGALRSAVRENSFDPDFPIPPSILAALASYQEWDRERSPVIERNEP